MRHSPRTVILGILAYPTLSAGIEITNAKELRETLLKGRTTVELTESTLERGCGPSGCSIDTDAVSIWPELQQIRQLSGKPIPLRNIDAAKFPGGLPAINWDPLGAYEVSRAHKLWGQCFELSHSGLGQSGSFQRWTSVLLIPNKGSQPAASAYRFIGYWLDCKALVEGKKADEVLLPTVMPTPEYENLIIIWRQCSWKSCSSETDARSVRKQANSEIGALEVKAE